jgi:hypothetical protein
LKPESSIQPDIQSDTAVKAQKNMRYFLVMVQKVF